MSAVYVTSPEFEFNGLHGLVFQRRQRTRSAVYGFRFEDVYEGTPSAVKAAFNSLAADQDARTVEEGPIHQLIISTADDPANAETGVYSTVFELPGNSLQQDMREHPKALALGQTTMNKIEEVLDITTPTSAELNSVGAVGSNARTLYDLMRQRKGYMSFQVSQFVFRVTTTVSRRSTFQIAYANLNKLYTFDQLRAETNPTTGFILSLDQIESQCAPASTPSGYAWAWLKQAPTTSMAPGNRIAIQNEYWLYEWSTFTYPPV